ncbi:MAG: hypothetical protein H6624_02625 [Bdellovibrionaceae bacterium]|nr:hypothetical protein [Bdellovibrionales bacterium]MCB9083206.1 hypothetical protein [Pseudobdellovibrionaceae bacterium]
MRSRYQLDVRVSYIWMLVLVASLVLGCQGYQPHDYQSSFSSHENELVFDASKRDRNLTLHFGSAQGKAEADLNGATVKGVVYVERLIKPGSVKGMGFMLDESYMGWSGKAPYDYPIGDGMLDTTQLADGPHSLHFTERKWNDDRVWNTIHFTVDNGSLVGVPGNPGTPPPTSPGPGIGLSKCSKFFPGNYVRATDDSTRNVDGLATLNYILSQDLTNFVGVAYQFMWGDVESSPGKYNFAELDEVLKRVKARGKKVILKFQDRTFWTGCNSKFVPSYVDILGPRPGGNQKFCTARVWEKETVDHKIRVLKAIVGRYHKDPDFIGILLEETALAVDKSYPTYSDKVYIDSLIRVVQELHSAYPAVILNQGINWMTKADHLRLAEALDKMGGGGGLNWPDSVPGNRSKWHWYDTGKSYNNKLMLMPNAQTPFIKPEETGAIYDMLVNDIGAHAIVWNSNHQSQKRYFVDNVIPEVNKRKGYIKNTTCPY